VPENPPTLTQFKQQVDKYEKIYLEVDKFEVSPSRYIAIELASLGGFQEGCSESPMRIIPPPP
jgi:hypothetical protein